MYGRSSNEESSVWTAGDCSGWLSADGNETNKQRWSSWSFDVNYYNAVLCLQRCRLFFLRCVCTFCYVTTSTFSALLDGVSFLCYILQRSLSSYLSRRLKLWTNCDLAMCFPRTNLEIGDLFSYGLFWSVNIMLPLETGAFT